VDDVDQVSRVVGDAADRTGRVQPVEVIDRMDLDDAIFAGHKSIDRPGAVRVGVDFDRRQRTERDGFHSDRHRRDARLGGIEHAVVVGVVIDVPADRGRADLGKVVVDAVLAAVELNAGNHVGPEHFATRQAVDGPGAGADTEVTGRLGLDNPVRAGQDVLEPVVAAGVGQRGPAGADVRFVHQFV
jgi:hypothetical protein